MLNVIFFEEAPSVETFLIHSSEMVTSNLTLALTSTSIVVASLLRSYLSCVRSRPVLPLCLTSIVWDKLPAVIVTVQALLLKASFSVRVMVVHLVDASPLDGETMHQFSDDFAVQSTFDSKEINCEPPASGIVNSV